MLYNTNSNLIICNFCLENKDDIYAIFQGRAIYVSKHSFEKSFNVFLRDIKKLVEQHNINTITEVIVKKEVTQKTSNALEWLKEKGVLI